MGGDSVLGWDRRSRVHAARKVSGGTFRLGTPEALLLLGARGQVLPPLRLLEQLLVLSQACTGATENRVQVGQLSLYDHDQLHRVAEIICHPKFNVSLSAAG